MKSRMDLGALTRLASALLMLAFAGCDASPETPGTDAGTEQDAGLPDSGAGHDAGDLGDAGSDDGGVDSGTSEPPPCERTQGVCAGARRAQVDGVYESVCTALSYGSDYEDVETRCDGLDNDCDGEADPVHASRVADLGSALHEGMVSSTRVDGGVLVTVFDGPGVARVLRLDSTLTLQGTTDVPVATTNAPPSTDLVSASMLRTERGPALVYSATDLEADRFQGYLVPLDESGALASPSDGGTAGAQLFDEPIPDSRSRAGASADGSRVLSIVRKGGYEQSREVLGVLADAQGQVLAGPKVLFRAVSESATLQVQDVLGLRNGEWLVAVVEEPHYVNQNAVTRLRRFDAALEPTGDERSFTTTEGPAPRLVDLGARAGAPLESAALLLRDRSDGPTRLMVTRDLFNGGMPEPLAVGPDREVVWYSPQLTERGLQVAWLSKAYVPNGTNFLNYRGRLWSQSEGHAPLLRAPGSGSEPFLLHTYAQWVLLEELEPRRMGALVMTSTPEGHVLEGYRYCVP